MKKSRARRTSSSAEREFVFRNGRPTAVIVPIEEYEALLRRLEDQEDLAVLREMKSRPLKFHSLEEVLKEFETGV